MYFNYLGFGFGLVILLVLVFGGLQGLHIPAGSFLDWVVGIASFTWLLVIVTVPWNIYFEAKEAIADANLSAERGIRIDERQVNYVKDVQKRSLVVIIALHVLSTIGLYTLAATGISAVGYVSSGAALLLTALRPSVRTYQYFSTRLMMIRQQFNYPREDIVEFISRFNKLQETVNQLQEQINPDDPRSLVATQQRQLEAIRNDLSRQAVAYEELKTINQAEHDRLGREAKQAIAQLSTDGQFLDHVREIIRFFKTA